METPAQKNKPAIYDGIYWRPIAFLVLIIFAVVIVIQLLVQGLSSTKQSKTLTSADKPITVKLTTQKAPQNLAQFITLRVGETYNSNHVPIRGLLFRLKISDFKSINVSESSIQWADMFSRIAGVKYALYRPESGYIEIAIANNADLFLIPETPIISFEVAAMKPGTHIIRFDADFEAMDIMNAENNSLLDKQNLNPLTLYFK